MERLTQQGYKYHSCDFMEDGVYEWANQLSAYEDTGLTPEQIMELKERDKPRKIELNAGVPICPVCGRRIVKCYDFCPDCGQRLKHKEERRWNENLKRH